MTGRRAGYCTGNDVPGYMNPGPGGRFGGFGMGRGRRGGGFFGGGFFGGGRGYRNWFRATGVPGWIRGRGAGWWNDGPYAAPVGREERIEALAEEANVLERELAAVRKELDALKSGSESDAE